AAGEPLPLAQDAIAMRGHAIEVRLCAEDPAQGFLPSIGRVAAFSLSDSAGVRLETAIRAGDVISPFYDSMIAKLITHRTTRDEAADAMIAVLKQLVVAGPRVNAAFLRALLDHADVRALRMDTGLIGRDIAELTHSHIGPSEVLASVARLLAPSRGSEAPADPWRAADGFQLGAPRTLTVPLMVNGEAKAFVATWPRGESVPHVAAAGAALAGSEPRLPTACIAVPSGLYAVFEGEQVEIHWPTYDADDVDNGHAGDVVRAPINGKVARIFVKAGDAVAKGDRL